MFEKPTINVDEFFSRETQPLSPEEARRQQKAIIGILFLCASLNGALLGCEAIGPAWLKLFENAWLYVWIGCGFGWCLVDSLARGRRLGVLRSFALFWLLPLGFLICMIESKGWKDGCIMTAKAAGVALASLLWLCATQAMATTYLSG